MIAFLIILILCLAAFAAVLVKPVSLAVRYEHGLMGGFVRWGGITFDFGKSTASINLGQRTLFSFELDKKKDGVKKVKTKKKKDKAKDDSKKSAEEKTELKGVGPSVLWEHRELITGIISKTLSLIKRIIWGFEIEAVRLEIGRLPVEPALAGQGYAIYYGFVLPNLPKNVSVAFEPFSTENREHNFEIVIRFYFYRLVAAVLYYIRTIPKMETYRFIKLVKTRK